MNTPNEINQNHFDINSSSVELKDNTPVFEENGTFCRVGSESSGFLEVDLQSFKQKGVEIRNISFAIPLGIDENNNPIKAEMLFMDEKDFLKFKDFIARLNWND